MLIDQLIDAYKVPSGEFTVVLPKGEELRFRSISSYEQFIRLKRDAAKFVRFCRSEKCPKDWKQFLPEDDEALITVSILSETSVEPKLEHLHLLKLSAHAGLLYNLIVEQWEGHQTVKQVEAEAEALDQLKNDSTATP